MTVKSKADEVNEARELKRQLQHMGAILSLQGREYITAKGLIFLARRQGVTGPVCEVQHHLSDPSKGFWVVSATVKDAQGNAITDIGDASPRTVSKMLYGAELRMASTRAKNRALRDALGATLAGLNIAFATFEEMPPEQPQQPQPARQHTQNRPPQGRVRNY